MSNINVESLNKGISAGYSFQLTEYLEGADFREVLKPSLITALTQPAFNNHMLHSFTYDKQTKTVGLPNVKSRTENGKAQQSYGASQLLFATGSFGTSIRVEKADWFGKRKVGGKPTEMKTESDALAEKLEQIQTAWDLHLELGLGTLLTADTNLLNEGAGSDIFPSYDYSLAINGASRAAIPVVIGTSPDDLLVRQTMAGYRKQLQQELSKLGKSASGFVCLCGDLAFTRRYVSEAQLNFTRELRTTVDLGSSEMPQLKMGGFEYDNFRGSDGILYINYGSEIIGGQPIIADNKAYLMPQMPGLFSVEYSPTMRRIHDAGLSNAMDLALPIYAFTAMDDYGVAVVTESNRLYFNPHPQLILELTVS